MGQARQRGTYEERRSTAKPREVKTPPPSQMVRIEMRRALLKTALKCKDHPHSIVIEPKSRTFTVNWSFNPAINKEQNDIGIALVKLGWRYKMLPDSTEDERFDEYERMAKDILDRPRF